MDWTTAWTGLLDSNFNALKTFLCSLSTCGVHNTLEQPAKIAILLQRGMYLKSAISDVASVVHASVADKDRQWQTE